MGEAVVGRRRKRCVAGGAGEASRRRRTALGGGEGGRSRGEVECTRRERGGHSTLGHTLF